MTVSNKLPFLNEIIVDHNGSILWDISQSDGYKGFNYDTVDPSATYYFTFTDKLRLHTDAIGQTYFIFDNESFNSDEDYTTLGVDNSNTTLEVIENALYLSISYEIIYFDVEHMKNQYVSLQQYNANYLTYLPPSSNQGISWDISINDGYNGAYYDYRSLTTGDYHFYFSFKNMKLTSNSDGDYLFQTHFTNGSVYTTLNIIESAISNSIFGLSLDKWKNSYQSLSQYYVSLHVDIIVDDISIVPQYSDISINISANVETNQGTIIDISNLIVQTGTIDTSSCGLYTLTYDIDASNNTFTTEPVIRNIYVIDDISLTLIGDASINMMVNTSYEEPGYYATNSIQEDVSDEVIVHNNLISAFPGIYTVTYTIHDFLGYQTQKTRMIYVFIEPYIILNGYEIQYIYKHQQSTYNYLGYNAYNSFDIIDNDNVEISSNLNMDSLGIYTKIYSYTDEYDYEADSKIQTFYVLDNLPPSRTDTIYWVTGDEPGYNGAFYDVSFLLNENNKFYFLFGFIKLVEVNGTYEFQDASSTELYHTTLTIIREAIQNTNNMSIDTWNASCQTIDTYNGHNAKIILEGDYDISFLHLETYKEYGYKVIDAYGANISVSVAITNNTNFNVLGTYDVYYDISDTFYSAKRVIRKVHVIDTTPPIISLNGGEEYVTLVIGNIYNDPVSAFDDFDGVITSNIMIYDDLNICKVGTYTRNYIVTNKGGKTTTHSRTIQVIEKSRCHPYAQDKLNQISSKMIRSKMIQTKNSFHYHSSKHTHINAKINSKNETINKQLLLSLGKSLYDKYFKRITYSSSLDISDKNDFLLMYENIMYDLTIQDEKTLGIYTPSESEIQTKQSIQNSKWMNNPYFTFYCTCVSNFYSENGSSCHFVIKNIKSNYVLIPGKKYKFDLSDSSNLGYQMSLSEKKYKFKDVKNIFFIGTPGETDACVIYKPSTLISLYKVFIYDKNQNSSSAFDEFGRIYPTILIEHNYKVGTKNYLSQNKIVECLSDFTEIRAIYTNGPKYFLEDPSVLPSGNIFKDRYKKNRQYGLYIGTYIIYNHDKNNPFTLITTSENIKIYGNSDNLSLQTLYGLSEDDSLDDTYEFYHGNIFIDVTGDFGTCGLYSYQYGYNELETIFTYSSECSDYAGESIEFTEMQNITDIVTTLKQENPTITISELENVISYYDYSNSYNTPFNFTSILTQSINDITYTVKDSFSNLDRVIIVYNNSYVAIDNSYNLSSNSNIENYQQLVSSTFHIVEDTSYNGYYRFDSELHSMYSLDISNDVFVFNDVWSIYRNDSSSYTIFSISETSLTPYGRYTYDSSSKSFTFETISESSISCTFVIVSNIDVSIPDDFNPTGISYVSNERVSWETTDVSYITQNKHYNGTTIANISSSYVDQVEISGNSSYTEVAAISKLNDIVLCANETNFSLRYDPLLYLSFRKAILSSLLESNTIVNGVLGMNLVPYVYFTNESDENGDYHPFMVIATYAITDKPNRLIDVHKPPGDGSSSYENENITRDAILSDYLIKIPLKDYGDVTNVDDNELLNSLIEDEGTTDSSEFNYYNYASTSSIGIAIDGVPIYPVLNNTLTPAQEQAEITNTGIHVGQGLQLHYHADGHGANPNGLHLYNTLDYSGNSHPPLIGFGYDGIALFGKYDSDYDDMYGYDISLDDFGGHTHSDDNESDISFGYHYHAHELDASDEELSTNSYSLHILMKGAWKGNIENIPEFWDTNNKEPNVKSSNVYTGH